MTLSVSGDSITFPDLSTQLTAPSGFGFKNRIINGDMRIDQRNAGAAVTPANGDYTIDRWQWIASQASKATVQQSAGAVTPPVGFTKYLGITSSSAYTVGAAEKFTIRQGIEGFNSADLGWGTATAQAVTLSFWVRSSLTGTFGGSLYNYDSNYAYPFIYSIPVANTWTNISLTIAGPTSGTWYTTSTGGIEVGFSLGAGATVSGTSGAWVATASFSATGATSVVGTSGATFYITGVQLEKGPTATAFDYRDYGRELSMCQRYFQSTDKSLNAGFFGMPYLGGLGQAYGSAVFLSLMRSAPTVILFDGESANQVLQPGVASNIPATAGSITKLGFLAVNRTSGTFSSGYGVVAGYTANAEL